MLHERAHPAAVRRLRAVVAGGHQEEEAHDDLVLFQALTVDLGVHEDARQVVGRVLAPGGDQLAAAAEDLGHVALHDDVRALGRRVRVTGAEDGVHEVRPDLVVLGRQSHEAADDARHDGLRYVADEIARLTAFEPLEHVDRDLADGGFVLRDPDGREAALEQRLDAVVLRRVHPDEHGLLELEREDRVLQRGEAADLRGVGLPVAADLVDVVSGRDGPEARLVGVLGDAVGPVDRALRAHLAKQLVRRAVVEMLPVADADAFERCLALVRGAHDVPSSVGACDALRTVPESTWRRDTLSSRRAHAPPDVTTRPRALAFMP
ncbi:hypothetical protein LRS13_03010 [Svornostia abyssi]|uniref:Uncharacterized protein n=1 Tax=Svornostia abyssi TaxID=2898438 RepID=A0ABY5PJJ2_9ACTN|nr:hypothetical protein LRS13_03010 [Parviterribacteraceae bacterium J379]